MLRRCCCVLLLLLVGPPATAADWPQAGGNPQHTNSTPDSPAPPYQQTWTADFSPEMFYSAQPVVKEGRVFQTTLNGSLYALDLATGKRLWHFSAGETIWSSAACGTQEHGGDGLVFVAGWDGLVYGLNAATGSEKWRFDAGEPISGAPCVADGNVFIGTRQGTMLALSAVEGKLAWKTPLSYQIFNTAAWDDGRVFVMTQDVVVHCLEAKTGKPLWRSGQLWGWMPREFYPVVCKGKVLINITPSEWRSESGFGIYAWARPNWVAKYSKLVDERTKEGINFSGERTSLLRDGTIPPELEEEQKRLSQWYEKQPQYQSFYVLDEHTGRQCYYAVHLYEGGGLENLVMPPAVTANGRLVAHCLFGGLRKAIFDLERNRWVDFLFEMAGTNNDNSVYVAVGGPRAFCKNFIGASYVMDLTTREAVAFRPRSNRPPLRVSVRPPRESPSEALSSRRLDWIAASYPAVIVGNYLLWSQQTPNRLTAYEGGRK